MTRDERIQAALDACYPDASRPSHGQLSRALDAALADVGGLEGLAEYLDDDRTILAIMRERDALRADRDRLREALREIAELPVDGSLVRFQAAVERACRVALRVSEAGT